MDVVSVVSALVKIRVEILESEPEDQRAPTYLRYIDEAADQLPWLRPALAAEVIGVKRQALDRWLARDTFAVKIHNSRRLLRPSEVVAVATEVERLRRSGHEGALLQGAVKRLSLTAL